MGFVTRLAGAWRVLLGRAVEPARAQEDEEALALRRDLAAARLEAQEAHDALAAERGRRAATEKAQATSVREGVESELEELFTRLAAPLSQLQMQQALLADGKPVGAADVMTLARQVAEAIHEAGLEPIGTPAGTMPFDPETAQPLSADMELAPGEAVLVKFVGYRYRGRVLRKALVEPVASPKPNE